MPDQSFIIGDAGTGGDHAVATRDAENMFSPGTFAFVYLPTCRPITLRTARMSGTKFKAWYYSPVNGSVTRIGTFDKTDEMTFSPQGNTPDTVIVLDDMDAGYADPGTACRQSHG
ncbi:MAG: hypothetical protein HC898_06810 [Phycisphaerales bacterium]|nr:hypothetical protein [Phycisphaerales bacterium]